MSRKTVSVIMLSLLTISTLTLAFKIQLVKADDGPIYINADGSITPSIAPISTIDNITYMLTGNITSSGSGIIIQKSNVIIDGEGYALIGSGRFVGGNGFDLSGVNLVTIRNATITNFNNGIYLYLSAYTTISGNNITNNSRGILGDPSFNHTLSDNNITNNWVGVWFNYPSSGNIYHGNFINNTEHSIGVSGNVNIWDDGYPSGGNYWSGYAGVDVKSGPYQNETGSDGIGDTLYTVNNPTDIDYCPLMNPWAPPDIAVTNLTSAKTVIGLEYTSLVNVTFENLGNKIEAFNATVYANSTCIFSEQTMLAMTNCTLSFEWNTTGFAYGNYTISAYAVPVSSETNTADNFMDGWVIVSIVGDITGGTPNLLDFVPDLVVDMKDVGTVASRFLTEPGKPLWDANADINGDGIVDMMDIGLVASQFEEYLLLLKVSTGTSDWTAFACLNGSISATPFNSSVDYIFIADIRYNEYPFLNFLWGPNASEKIYFCLVAVNPNYIYSLGRGGGWATYEFYSVNFQSGSMQVGSEILSLQASYVTAEGRGALDGTLFKFP